MPSVFPGMDPYLEAPWIWPDFHNSLADSIRSILNEKLPKPYFAQLEARSELGIRSPKRIVAPDVSVVRDEGQSAWPATDQTSVAVADQTGVAVSSALRVEFNEETITLTSISIRDTRTQNSIVTLIEILSPSNKRSGQDREHYVQRMREILNDTVTSLIEIDLLRIGQRTWERSDIINAHLDELEKPTDYLVTTSRSWSRSGADIYPISLTESLPVIAVPLLASESDVALNLQAAFQRTYDGGPYRRGAVDYKRPPFPSLNDSQEQWRIVLMTGAR